MKNSIKQFALSAILLNLGILLGRFSGFLREIIIANNYGATYKADLTIVLLTLPDILINILVGGALSAALIPNMVSKPELAKRLTYQASLVLFFTFTIISSVFYFYSEGIVGLFAPGFSGNLKSLTDEGIKYIVFVIPFFVITGVLTAYLQSKEKFTIPSLGTLFFNSVIILFLVFMMRSNSYSVELIVIAVLCAGLVRYFSQLIMVKYVNDSTSIFGVWLVDKELINRYFQAMLSGSLIFVFPVMARSFSTFSGEGSLSIFSYAMRLVEFPLLISVTFITILFLPKFAKSFESDIEQFKAQLLYASQFILVLGLASSVTLIAATDTYVELVYGSSFDVFKLNEIKILVRIGLVGLLFQGFVTVFISAFNATRKTSIPMKVNLIAALLLFIFLSVFKNIMSLEDIMLSLVITYLGLFACYLYFVRGWLFNIESDDSYFSYYILLIIINFISGISLYAVNTSLEGDVLKVLSIALFGLLSICSSIVLHPFIRIKITKRLQNYV